MFSKYRRMREVLSTHIHKSTFGGKILRHDIKFY